MFAATATVATSTWAFFGAAIKDKLQNDAYRRGINSAVALLLIYLAVKLASGG